MKTLSAAIALTVGLVSFDTIAQDMTGAIVQGLANGGLKKGEELLNKAPGHLDKLINEAEGGRKYSDPAECRGSLQLAAALGAITTNLLPFSNAWTLEDERGPVVRIRAMINGEGANVEIYCDGSIMNATKLSWGGGDPTPRPVTKSTLDAFMGAMLVLKLQGAFEEAGDANLASASPAPNSLDDAKNDNMVQLLEPWTREKKTGGGISANVKSLEVNDGQLRLDISCKHRGRVWFFLGEILAKPANGFAIRTGSNGNEKEFSFLAEVSTTSIISYDQETFNGLISALEKNGGDTFSTRIETFDGPAEFVFSMSGFAKAIEPVRAFCAGGK